MTKPDSPVMLLVRGTDQVIAIYPSYHALMSCLRHAKTYLPDFWRRYCWEFADRPLD